LAARLDHHAAEGTTGRIARRIGRTLPLFHGAGPVGAAVADHWKFQANRHGKVAAWAAATPDLRHDEVCSWGQHGDVTRQVFTGVFLRGGYEATGDAEQLDRYEDLLDEFVAAIEVVVAAGTDPLADVCELAVLGEQVGLAIALGEGFDPDPAPGLEWRV
jgi:glucose/mannose-6-phosphate isomerase